MHRLNWIPLVLCVGCVPDPAGIWLLTLTPDEEGANCTETLTENFTYGYEIGDAANAEWTYEESASYADELVLLEILETTPQNVQKM